MKRNLMLVVCGLSASAAMAQTSPLYMISYDTNQAVIVQNGQVITSWNNSDPFRETGLAIHDTIRVIGRNGGQNGREYDLAGNPLGGGPYNNPSFDDLYDGTTDGTFNYSVAHNDFDTDFAVVRGDADWGGVGVLFVPTERSSGITYDSSTGTLWVVNYLSRFLGLQEYDLEGNLLTDLSLASLQGGLGLAYDPADDTFWITGGFNGGTIDCFQLDKQGNVLQTVDLPQFSNSWASAEILAGNGGCAADLDGDGDVDADDFFAYLDGFAAGDLGVCDIDGDGDCDADDFFGYLDLFAAGC